MTECEERPVIVACYGLGILLGVFNVAGTYFLGEYQLRAVVLLAVMVLMAVLDQTDVLGYAQGGRRD